jgi:hypothetical protein
MTDIASATKNFLSTLIGASAEPERPKSNYVFGQPTPHRHYAIEEQDQRRESYMGRSAAYQRFTGRAMHGL